MFGIGLQEFLLIALLCLIFLKPGDFPKLMASLGKILGKIQSEIDPLQSTFKKNIDDLKFEAIKTKHYNLMKKTVSKEKDIDPKA